MISAPFWRQRCKIRKVFLLVIRISFISSFADPRGLSKLRTASEERKTKRSAPPTPTAASTASTASTNVASAASEQKQQDFCPSCGEAFDCGKKRRLIDSCGHERCYMYLHVQQRIVQPLHLRRWVIVAFFKFRYSEKITKIWKTQLSLNFY